MAKTAGTTQERVHQGRQGLNGSPDPFSEERCKGGPPEQAQEWPGRERDMNPRADHGEESYRGGDKLQGLSALITGGDSGIGKAVAIAFAREGADVAIAYYDEDDDAEDTVCWVEKAGRRAMRFPGDLRDPRHCREIVDETARQFGKLNILVNNAAYHIEQGDFLSISPEQLDQTFRTNLFAYIWTAQAAVPIMQPGDTIINTGSVVAMMGYASLIDYAASKAAIHNFTQSLSQAVAERGIRVNCVAPGPVWTPLIPSTRDKQFVKSFGANALWQRPAQPIEIATSYVFLASADARYYTGEVLAPTGFTTTSR